jgi:hypothetical protein
VALFCLALIIAMPLFAQVQVVVPKKQYKLHDKIDVAIANDSAQPVSLCVEFGHLSFPGEKDDVTETTPTPVHVQSKHGRKWSALLNGPDIGSSRHSVLLGSKETQHYPMRLSDSGEMRLVLGYWIGEGVHACENPQGRKTAASHVFVVR